MPNIADRSITFCPFFVSNLGGGKLEPFMYVKQEIPSQPKHPFRVCLMTEHKTPEEAISVMMEKYGVTEFEIHETTHQDVFVVHVLEGQMQNEMRQVHTVQFFAATAGMHRQETIAEGFRGTKALADFMTDFMRSYKPIEPVMAQ